MATLVSTNNSTIIIGGARSDKMSTAAAQVEMHEWTGTSSYSTVLRGNAAIADAMITLAKLICLNNYFLYSQAKRESGNKKLKEVNWDVTKVNTTVYLDCSSFIATCVLYAGTKLNRESLKNVHLFCTTNDEVPTLLKTGEFTLVKLGRSVSPGNFAGLMAGDILHRDGHTELVISIDGTTFATYNYGGPTTEAEYAANTGAGGNGNTGYNIGSTITGPDNATVVIRDYHYSYEYETKTVEYDARVFRSADETLDLLSTSLLTYPTLVESPFIQLKVGTYTFGTYKLVASTLKKVLYPNYISNMTVKKTNGLVNEYTITLVHQIEPGADPNIVDKILSTISSNRIVYISYGDYNSPTFTYKEEEAILISSTSNTEFAGSRVTYTLSCTSNATLLYGKLFSFEKTTALPSSLIVDMLWGSGKEKYGLLEAFPGMKNKTNAITFIASDDLSVELEAKPSTDPITYINYLVSCMCSKLDSLDAVLKSATYKLGIFDTTFGGPDGINGSYFKIVKISTSDGDNATLGNNNIYEVDVGYPTDNMVMEFNVKEDQTWSLLYNYSGDIKEAVYNLTPDGTLKEEYLPKLAVSKSKNKMTEVQKTWWTNMTKFPVGATLKLKGLVKPAMLTTYVRINALFYGLRHISSGLYFITSQTDSVSGSGYRTELGLLRIAGDNEYLTTVKKTKTERIPTKVIATSSTKEVTNNITYYGGGQSTSYASSGDGYYTTGGRTWTETTANSSGSRLTESTLYLKNPYSSTGDIKGYTDTDPDSSCLASCAALAVMLSNTDPIVIKWGASAIQNRIEDLKNTNKLSDNVHFYLYIHCNKNVINSYNLVGGVHSSSVLYLRYKQFINETTIFPNNSAYAYDVVLEECTKSKARGASLPYDKEFTCRGIDGKIFTVPGISKQAADGFKTVLGQGLRFTTANYFNKTWRKLDCGTRHLNTSLLISNSLTISGSGIGTDEASYGINTNYWQLGKTVLTATDGVTCTYVGHPNNNTKYPAFGVDKSIAIIATTSSFSSSTGSDAIDESAVWKQLRNAGFTAAGAAGLMGNILCEGGLSPKTVEYSFCRDLIIGGAAVNENSPYKIILNSITNFMDTCNTSDSRLNLRSAWMQSGTVTSGYKYWGYGMIQWTTLSRKKGLISAAKSLGKSVGAYESQFQFMINELNGDYISVGNALKTATDPAAACKVVFDRYEGPGDGSLPNRQNAAITIYNKYKNIV